MSNPVSETTATLLERPRKVKIGWRMFKVHPLTLAQIYEMGAIVEGIEGLDLHGEVNVIVETLRRFRDMERIQRLVMVMLFRNKRKRWWWRRYIKRHLTIDVYQNVLETGMATFKAAFFLTSITFLKGVQDVTKTTNTAEVTAHGGSSEA